MSLGEHFFGHRCCSSFHLRVLAEAQALNVMCHERIKLSASNPHTCSSENFEKGIGEDTLPYTVKNSFI